MLGEDKETRERLIDSALSEFSERGYMKASLRKICAGAGVTTGALYFFFKDKEDLFAAIVEPPLVELKMLLAEHFGAEDEWEPATWEHKAGDHDKLSAALIRHIYANYNAIILLISRSQGSRFENVVDEMADMIEKRYLSVAKKLAKALNKRVNRYMLHWLSHMIIDAFVNLITHEPNEKKAIKIISRIMDNHVGGWIELVFEDKGKSRS